MDIETPQNTKQSPQSNGASAFAPYPTIAADVDSLPMVVWLRGDEPYFEQFSYDADTAMAELSIKRSRLTQISGKELRVGRVRMGRYIKPVFRKEDLEKYKSWTRPTASHKKSSTLIDDATQILTAKAEYLESLLASNSLEDSITAKFERSFSEIRTLLTTLKTDNSQRLNTLEANIQQTHNSVLSLNEIKGILKTTPEWANIIISKSSDTESLINTRHDILEENLGVIANAVAAISEQTTVNLEAIAKSHQKVLQKMTEVEESLNEAEERPLPRHMAKRAAHRSMLSSMRRNPLQQQYSSYSALRRKHVKINRKPKWT
jgi:hypothetical protein